MPPQPAPEPGTDRSVSRVLAWLLGTLVVLLLGVLVWLALWFSTVGQPEYRPGECLNPHTPGAAPTSRRVDPVDCGTPHAWQVFAAAPGLRGAEGEVDLARATPACEARLVDFVGTGPDAARYRSLVFWSNPRLREFASQDTLCLLYLPGPPRPGDNDLVPPYTPMVGSARHLAR